MPSTQLKGCDTCGEYISGLHAKIENLQGKLNEMKAENKKLLTQLNFTTNKVLKDDEKKPTLTKCDVCWKELEERALDTHLCLRREFIICSYCWKRFNNTKSLVDHLKGHADEIRNNKTTYKCNKCPNAYPIPILLDCHRLSHVRQIKPPATNNVSTDCNQDDDILEPSVAIDDSIAIKTEITDSTDEEELLTPSIPATTISHSTEMTPKCKRDILHCN